MNKRAERHFEKLIDALAFESDNDEDFGVILLMAYDRWKQGKASRLLKKIKNAQTNWQHANLTQLEPSVN